MTRAEGREKTRGHNDLDTALPVSPKNLAQLNRLSKIWVPPPGFIILQNV